MPLVTIDSRVTFSTSQFVRSEKILETFRTSMIPGWKNISHHRVGIFSVSFVHIGCIFHFTHSNLTMFQEIFAFFSSFPKVSVDMSGFVYMSNEERSSDLTV